MATLIYKETTRDQLSQLAIQSGQIIRCYDTSEIFYDVTNSTRIKTTKVQLLSTEDDRVALEDPNDVTLYITIDSKSFYRYLYDEWKTVSDSSDIVDIIAIYTGLNIGTSYVNQGADKIRYGLRTLAKAVYTEDGHTVEEALMNITKLGTSIAFVTATQNNQTSFEIPFPFEEYLEKGNSFMVYIGTTFVDNRRWTMSSDQKSINFMDGYSVKLGRTVTFVFLFNSKAPINTELLSTNMDGKYLANGTVPIIKMERYSSSLTLDDINSVATSAAVHRLYTNLLNKLDAMNSKYTTYMTSTGDGTTLAASSNGFVLEDSSIIHLRLNTSIMNNATLSINGGDPIPIYRDFFNPIATGDAFERDVLSLFYSEEDGRFYVFTGIHYRLYKRVMLYTTLNDYEDTFNIQALDFDPIHEILDVYQDGIYLVEGAHYVNNNNGSISLLGYQAPYDTEFIFRTEGLDKVSVQNTITTLAEGVPEQPEPNPGGEGDVYEDESQDINDNVTVGNWRIYTDVNGSNNLLFLYNNLLKFTMTPAGEFIASTLTERDQ